MSARLVPVKLTAVATPAISLQRPVVLVGRHPECDVRIDSPQVSRRHCCVAMAYDRVMIRDLGSRNGVRVNGRIIEEASLQPGDEVAIGPYLYRVEGEGIAPASPLPPPPARVKAPAPAPAPATPRGSFDDMDDLFPISDL